MLSSVERAAATRKTLAKYRTLPFDWSKRATCIHLARYHLRNMGHRPPAIPDFRSALGAKRALEKTGFADMAALLDSLLPSIAPASAWVGDLAVLEGGEGFDSIVIHAGGKWLGYHMDDLGGLKPLVVTEIKGAWRA
ncbi:hypothetical protein sphantq_02930 [Sphingobium sp. AntQ-1]|uniref:DUF6950 family protein n=1 Tax=Sphingobium sp. AntQ-1 TaxID=2930091 RepID=UPI00234E66F9|nr:hypothetical protein [Sphingobium sp. AntQ-1]WCP14484.1 hypothetical protein sphantq_02930 [Sphingobium sp. AntQ-1]